jgi:hypothetical protein
MGGATRDLDSVQRTFMTVEAHKLLWSKVSTAYWFWKIYQGAGEAARALPITEKDVQVSLDAIHDSVGLKKIWPNYDPDKDSTVNGMRYLRLGVLILEKAENGAWKIRTNAIFN